jgi:parallel beta-helix repeat protein
LTSHGPIYIEGNDNFTAANGVVAGSGTDNDPYIIEGWEISAENANGIEIMNTTAHFVIRNCYIHDGLDNWKFGIYFNNVVNGRIENVHVENNSYGVKLYSSSNNICNNLVIRKNVIGIFLEWENSYNNIISNNLVENAENSGICLAFSWNNIISNNLARNNGWGITLWYSDNNVVSGNTVENNSLGIYLQDSDNNRISNNIVEKNGTGIDLNYSDNNTISNNITSNNSGRGIGLRGGSDNNLISNNLVENNIGGISIEAEPEPEEIDFPDNNLISNNVIKNNYGVGIQLLDSSNNLISNNLMENTAWDPSEVTNGGLGIQLWYSNNNLIENNIAENNTWVGIELYVSDNNRIENNITKNNHYGIELGYSDNNIVSNNTSENNHLYGGIYLWDSYYNLIENNIAENNDYGISIRFSSNNNIVSNNIAENNDYGIYIYESDNNRIYHNNFINNTNQVRDDGSNYWDNGYPSGGNYWSDYTGTDNYRGENQSIPGSDGIGDTPYYIPYENINCDRYPLMNPWSPGGLIPHAPIYIDGNSNFIPANGVVAGSGTENDPYIIENWVINASSDNEICIENTTAHFVVRNCVVEDGHYGIYFAYVTNGKIDNCTAENNWEGIYLSDSSNNIISNTAANYNYGPYDAIGLWDSDNNLIENCTVNNNGIDGIYIHNSSSNRLRNNILTNNKYNLHVWGTEISHFYQDIDNSNETNGRPIYYIIEQENLTFDGSVRSIGFLALISCENILARNLNISNNNNGVLLANTAHSKVTNCIFNSDAWAIDVWGSSNNTFTNCHVENSGQWGAAFTYSSDNNSIYHNNFINNANQAWDNCSNYWDNDYPSGGNYWSDYIGTDNYRGENQDILGSDGIGDTPFDIPGNNNQDRYPLMRPWHAPIYIVGNENFIPANGVTSGSGTAGDPYIIENWDISAENAHGIEIRNTTANFVVRNCYLHDIEGFWAYGIYFENVTNGEIVGCIAGSNSFGIYLENSDNNIIGNNIAENNGKGIHLYYSNNNTFSNNTCSNNADYGIQLEFSFNNTLVNNICESNGKGDTLGSSIDLSYSHNNTLDNNTCDNNGWGIRLSYSYGNLIKNCIVVNNQSDGIELYHSGNNTIENCAVSNNSYRGIWLIYSSNNILRNNILSNNIYAFGVWSYENISEFYNDIDNSNKIDGKPIYYMIKRENLIFDGNFMDMGYLGLVSCENILVKNLDMDNLWQGILLADTSHSTIENSTFSDTYWGIDLNASSNNVFTNCTLCYSVTGIALYGSSDNNIIINFTLENNSRDGIRIWHFPSNNTVKNCTIENSGNGIIIYDLASNNRIYRNNFVNNENQAYDNASSVWDNGYPSGGNYWSDYTGVDENHGENQDILGSDGIGDTPYAIPGGTNQDNYPLMNWPLNRGVNVSISPWENSGKPYENLNYTVLVTNTGNIIDSYALSVTDNVGWKLNILPAFLIVLPGNENTATLGVHVPYCVEGGTKDNITVTARSQLDDKVENSNSCIAHVQVVHNVELIIEPQYQSGLPGTWLEYMVTIKNMGNVADSYDLEVIDALGWGAVLDDYSLWVDRCENENSTILRVPVPTFTEGCTMDNILVIARLHENESVSDNAWCIAHVTIVRGVEVSISPSHQSGLNEAALTYTVTVANTGNVWDNYLLIVNDSSGWDNLTLNNSSLVVPPFENRTTTLRVHIPDNAIGCTNNEITVTAISTENENVKDNANCIAHVTIVRGVDVTISPKYQENLPGEMLDYTVTITNMGNVDDTYDLTATDNESWDVSIASSITVPAFENKTTKLTVTIPEDAVPCTKDNIRIVATSRENVLVSAEDSCVAHVKLIRIVTLSISPSYQSGKPGELLSYAVTVKNWGNVVDSYILEVTDTAGWGPTLSENQLDDFLQSENRTITLGVVVPSGATGCTVDSIFVTAISMENSLVRGSGNCQAHATIVRGVEISVSPEHQSGPPGTTFNYTITVKNTGNVLDTYDLSVSDNANWGPTVSPMTLTLAAGASDKATLSVTIPENAEHCMQDNLLVVATSISDPTVNAFATALAQALKFSVSIVTDKSSYNRGDNVIISGAAKFGDGSPITDAPVEIGITTRGFIRRFTARTDSTGNYSLIFGPSSSEAGIYEATATILIQGYTRTDNTQFVINGLLMDPTSVHLDMIANSGKNILISLSNIGETELTGILPVLTDENVNDNLIAILDTGTFKTQLQPDEQTSFIVELMAGADLSHDAVFRVYVSTEQGSLEKGEIDVTLHPNIPLGFVSPTEVITSLNPGDWYTAPIVIANKGYGNWENVRLTSPSLNWIYVVQPLTIGDLCASAENLLDLCIHPDENVLPGVYDDNISVISSNYSPIIINISVRVTTAEKGSLLIHTVDILGRDVTGCGVTLQNQENYSIVFQRIADPDNAWVRFDNLPIGYYKCTVTSSLSEPVVKTVVIEPEVEKFMLIKLDVPLVNVGYSLTPTSVPDVYSVTLNITFETEIPQPVLIPIPLGLDLVAKPGRSSQYEFKIWNEGLARVENVSISPLGAGSRIKLELLPSFITKIDAGEEVSIALKVTVDNTVKFGETFTDNIEIEGAFSFFVDNQIENCLTKTNLPVVIRISPRGELRIDPLVVFKFKGIFENLLSSMENIRTTDYATKSGETDLLTALHDMYWDNEVQTVYVTNMEAGSINLTQAHGIAADILKTWVDFADEDTIWEGILKLLSGQLMGENYFVFLHGYFDESYSSENYLLGPGQTVPLHVYGIPENTEPKLFYGWPLPTIWMGDLLFSGQWWENTRCRYSVPLLLIDFHLGGLTIGWGGWGGGWLGISTSVVEPSVKLRISPYLQGGVPGETLSYAVSVITTGSVPSVYDLSVENIWPVKLNKTSISSNETAILEIKIPDNAQHGDNDMILITATAKENSEFSDNANCVSICSISPLLWITPVEQIGLHPGDNLVYKIYVKNFASVADNFKLSIVKQDGWPFWPTMFDNEIIEIGPNDVGSAELTVTIPLTTAFGEKRSFEVEARSIRVPISYDNNTCDATLFPVVKILPPIQHGEPGENLLYAVLITNPLSASENFSLTVESEWPAILGRDKITLGPEGYTFVGLEVALPENAKFMENTSIKVSAAFSLGTASGTCEAMVAETFTERVQFRISQTVVLERDAFDARIDLSNNTSTIITGVKIDVQIKDNDGQDASDLFYVSPPSLSNIGNLDGTGTIDPGKIASGLWTIIPTPDAAGDNGRAYVLLARIQYTVGGLSYTWSGEKTFTVYPQPELALDYYLPQRVVENVPFFLAVSVKNVGKGIARDLRIVSSQPEIVSNIAGVPVKLNIEGSWVKGKDYGRTLIIDFGDLPPGSSTVGVWKMVCNFSGRFIDFNAEFTHLTWGGERTSLIKSIGAHILVRQVINDAPAQDNVFDLLTDTDNNGVPDQILDIVTSENTQVNQVTAETIGEPTYWDPNLLVRLEKENQWIYASLPDPLFNMVDVLRIVRSFDNRDLDNRNFWQENGKICFIDDAATEYVIVYDRTQMKGAIASYVSPSYLSGLPGATLDYTINIANLGDVADNYVLSGTDNTGWSLSIFPTQLEVLVGENRRATLSVTIPSDAIGGTIDNITVTATSQADNNVSGSASCTAQVTVAREVSVSISPSDNSGANGALLTYIVAVTNNGNVSDTYDLTFGDNAGWSPNVLPTKLSLAAFGSSGNVTLSVTIPSLAIGGTVDSMWVQAKSENDAGVFDNKSCIARVTTARSVGVSISPHSQSGSNGAILTYIVTVTNTGNVSDNYALTNAADNTSWSRSILPTSLVVAPFGSTGSATLSVTIPSNAVGGTSNNIMVTATGTGVNASDNCTATVTISRGVTVSISPSWQSGVRGATLTYIVTVHNTGNVPDNYSLTVTDNAGWSPSVLPTSLVVAPFSSENATLSVTIPLSATGDTQDNLAAFAISQSDPSVSDSESCMAQAVLVAPVRRVSISISPTSKTGIAGTTLTYNVTIRNRGNVVDNYTLSVADNSGWGLTLSTYLLENVKPGQSRVVILSVAIPAGVIRGTRDNITVIVTSQSNNTISNDSSCIARVK